MRKLIKKSLACCLVVVLTLTAMVGAFATSAESVATVTAANVEVANGETSVTVPVTIEVTDGFYAAYIQVASEFGALTAVSVPADADYDVTADGYTAVDLATGKMLVMSIYGDSLRNDITEAVVNCTFTADAAPAAGTYAVTVTCPDVDVPAADWAESVVALTPVDGVITVAAHECTEVIDAAVAPTCTETGLTEGKHCSECGKVIVAQEVVDALGHAWVDGEITYTDCTSAGNMAQSCSRCDATQTVAVDPKGHTEVAYKDVAATCTTVGYTGGTYCSECNAIITERTEVPVIPHNYVDGTCGVCGAADPDYEPECDHANADLPFSEVVDNVFVYAGVCSDCGKPAEKRIEIGAAYTGTVNIGRSIEPKNDISMFFRFPKAQIKNYSGYVLEVTKEGFDPTYLTSYIESTTNNTAVWEFRYTDLYAWDMTREVDVVLYGYSAAENKMIPLKTSLAYSVLKYATNTLASTDDAKLKVALIDLLNYGAAIQEYKNMYLDDLPNVVTDTLTEEMLALGTKTVPDANTDFDVERLQETQYNSTKYGKVQIGKSFAPENTLKMELKVSTAYTGDINDLYFKIEYKDRLGNEATPEIINVGAAEGTSGSGVLKAIKFDKAPISTLNYPVLISLYHGNPDEDGAELLTYTEYSIEKYIEKYITTSDAKLLKVLQTIYNYGYSLADFSKVPKLS